MINIVLLFSIIQKIKGNLNKCLEKSGQSGSGSIALIAKIADNSAKMNNFYFTLHKSFDRPLFLLCRLFVGTLVKRRDRVPLLLDQS